MANCSKCGSITEKRVLFQVEFYDHCFKCDSQKKEENLSISSQENSIHPWLPKWFVEGAAFICGPAGPQTFIVEKIEKKLIHYSWADDFNSKRVFRSCESRFFKDDFEKNLYFEKPCRPTMVPQWFVKGAKFTFKNDITVGGVVIHHPTYVVQRFDNLFFEFYSNNTTKRMSYDELDDKLLKLYEVN